MSCIMVGCVQEVMGFRDDAEVAAVEALKEASAAENLLRRLRSSHPLILILPLEKIFS